MLNRGNFDWVNIMSYHYNAMGNTWAWKKDIWTMLCLWGMDPSRINLGADGGGALIPTTGQSAISRYSCTPCSLK